MVSLFEIDFLSSTIAAIAMAALGLMVFIKGARNISSVAFLLFVIISALWGALNYLNYQIDNPAVILWIIRTIMFLAVLQAFSFFLFIYTFPNVPRLPRHITLLLAPLVSGVALLTLSPFVFSGLSFVQDGVSRPIPAPGIALFGILAISLVIGGVVILVKKMKRAGGIEKMQFIYLLVGTGAMFSLIIVFNFFLPVLFKNTSFIPFSGIFILPFVIATTYAIFRHQLFNIRVIATELFAALIIIVFLFNTFLSKTLRDTVTNGVMLVLVTVFGALLVRGTLREIRQLEKLSKAKSEFVSIASHQLRTPLTAIKGFVSMIKEGSGTEELRKNWLEKIYVSNERLIRLVNDLLNISRIERGTLQYSFGAVNIVALIDDLIEDFQPQAEEKGISLAWERPAEEITLSHADEQKLRQVILNLIDNAIKYTGKGSVVVRLHYFRELHKARIIVQDTGIGMRKEDIEKIFGLFSRGEGGEKTWTEGLGIGLYVAQKIVVAHNGKIWAESEGHGKGSRFYVELPAS